MFKKIVRGILNLLLISTIITFIAATTSVILFTPGHFKQWLQNSNAYETLPNTILNQSKTEQVDNTTTVSLSDPIVMAAAQSSISSDFVQKSTEQIIESVFVWLRGDTPNPTFSIDLLPVKQAFADKIVVATKDRYNQLPQCKPGDYPVSSSPLTIECRPIYGVDINKATEDLRTEILQNKEFLPESAITSANLAGSEGASTLFNSKTGPQTYQYMQFSPYVLAGLILVYTIGLVLLSETKRKGFKRVGVLLIVSGVLAMISAWITSLGYGQYQDKLFVSAGEVTKDIVIPLFNAFRNDATTYTIVLSGAVSGLGILIVVLAAIIKNRTKSNTKVGEPTPKNSAGSDTESPLPSEKVANVRSTEPVSNPQSNKNDSVPTTAPEVSPKISKKLIQ